MILFSFFLHRLVVPVLPYSPPRGSASRARVAGGGARAQERAAVARGGLARAARLPGDRVSGESARAHSEKKDRYYFSTQVQKTC